MSLGHAVGPSHAAAGRNAAAHGRKQLPCHYFQRTGTCRFGDGCRFAHALPAVGGDRKWSHAEASTSTAADDGMAPGPSSCAVPFTFMTYNVLADALAHKHWAQLYRHVTHGALVWEGRFGRCERLLAEIQRHMPDVLTLQEVDHFAEFQAALGSLGYEGQHLSRTGGRTDGCATFWNRSAFELVQSRRLCFEDHGLRDNVALLTLLRPRQQQAASQQGAPVPQSRQQAYTNGTGNFANGGLAAAAGGSASGGAANGYPAMGDSQSANGTGSGGSKQVVEAGSSGAQQQQPLLLVGNTHILFNPKRGDIKLAQVRVLLEAAAALAPGVPAIIAGDFNSAPASGVHRFCSAGELELPAEDRSRLSGQHGGGGFGGLLGGGRSRVWSLEELRLAMGESPAPGDAARGIARHPLLLRSAYTAVDGSEPAFSTSHGAAFTTVDYIWYTPQAESAFLRPTAVLAPPHPSTARDGLPSMAMPSDHIPLLARFELSAAAAAKPADAKQTGREWARQKVAQNGGIPSAAADAVRNAAADGRGGSAVGALAASNGAGDVASSSGGSSGGGGLEPEAVGGQGHVPHTFLGIGTVL